jgi:hypothetical protein
MVHDAALHVPDPEANWVPAEFATLTVTVPPKHDDGKLVTVTADLLDPIPVGDTPMVTVLCVHG